MKFIKYFSVFILFAIGGFYSGLFLYHYRQKDGKTEQKITENIEKDTQKQTEIQSQIPEHLTEEFWKNITPDQLKKKLQTIVNINEIRPDNGKNMLHLLAIHGKYPEMVSLLIDKGVNYKLKDTENKAKALHYAVIRKEKTLKFIKEFLKYDNVNEPGGIIEGTTVMWAVYMRMPIEVIKFLLEQGVDPHFQSEEGNNAITLASIPNKYTGNRFIDPKVIQLLLDHKVDIKIKNSKGKTAYDFMKENEEFKKTELFKEVSQQFQTESDNQKAEPLKQ